jgi:RNA polymerase sigma-70 factor (ECF subfamily)
MHACGQRCAHAERVPDDDQALVARAVAGDAAAFRSLYDRHAGAVWALLTRMVGARMDREDLLQETFWRLHQALPAFRGECALRTFVHGIAARTALDACRKRRRDDVRHAALAEVAAVVTPLRSRHAGVELLPDARAALARLDGLAPRTRIAFVLRELHGYSFVEIGQMTGCFTTTARMRVAAARRQLAAAEGEGV